MPSSTPKQAKFMAAVAHGWKPDRVKAPPVAVAKEFNAADAAKHAGRKKVAEALHKRKQGHGSGPGGTAVGGGAAGGGAG